MRDYYLMLLVASIAGMAIGTIMGYRTNKR